jgi:hypothetical protein
MSHSSCRCAPAAQGVTKTYYYIVVSHLMLNEPCGTPRGMAAAIVLHGHEVAVTGVSIYCIYCNTMYLLCLLDSICTNYCTPCTGTQ